MKLKRKKVIDSRPVSRSINLFDCDLECGHTEAAYGIRSKDNFNGTPPKTVSCRKCSYQNKEKKDGYV